MSEELFSGGGEMGALMRTRFAYPDGNGAQSLLGPVSEWPQSLKTAVSIVLNSRYPMFVWWGPHYANLYNDAYRPILGSTKHPQFLGQSAKECWKDVWDVVGPLADRVLATGESTWSENLLLLMHRDGYVEETYFTFSYSPIRDESGGVGGVFCAVTETTEQVIRERRLRTLRELASATSDAKTVEQACQISVQMLSTNPADIPFALLYLIENDGRQARLAGMIGIEDQTFARPDWIDLTQADDCWRLAQVQSSGEAEMIDDLITRFGDLPSGAWEETPHSAIVLPMPQSGKQQLAGLLVLGISPRLAWNEEYRGFFDVVASNVATALTNTYAYEEERKQAEALAELDRAKTAFFNHVSHEFRTPLTLMLGPLEDLATELDGRLQPDEREQLQLIQRNSLRLQKLVNTLLEFSRIEAGRMQATYEPIDLAGFTTELASVFRSLIERAGLALTIDCPALPELVYVDRDMWEKIVLNLISNAFKFTFAGQITVRLRASDQTVELSIADTGIGIPEAELPHLFERFHRVAGARSRSYEGTGIGLALVQELVKLQGGSIRVASQVGCGTTFTIALPLGTAHLPRDRIQTTRPFLEPTALGAAPYVAEAWRWLPAAETEAAIETQATQPLPTSDARLPLFAPVRILVADDNADMRDYVKRLLSPRFEVETVANGAAALAAIQAHPPALVLTDVMMPELDGFGLLRSLRATPETQGMPIILLSACAEEAARIEGLEAGADDYLIKPFSARELLARVEATLKLARLRQEATQREHIILNRITDAFMALDRDFRFTYANEAAQQISRTSLKALLGKTMWEAFPATIATQFEFQYRRALNEQIAVEFEEYYAPLDVWIEVHVYPSESGLSLFFRDTTDRKRAEEVQLFLAAIVQSSSDAIIGCTPDGRIASWNASAERIFGYAAREAIGQEVSMLVPSDRANESSAIVAAMQRGESINQLETVRQRKDGALVDVSITISLIRDAENRMTGVSAIVQDITNRRQAKEALRQSESRFRLMVESAKDYAIFTLDMQGYVTSWNSGAQRLLGYQEAEIVGKLGDILFTLEDLERGEVDRERQKALEEGRAENERWHVRRDGSHFWASGLMMPLHDETHQIQGFLKILRDMTVQKQSEAERDRLLVREQAAREEAERANRIKDEFLTVLSHELRSPLNPILGWSKLLQQGRLDATRTATALATIERNAKLQVQLIDDLLDVSRILRGKLTLNTLPVHLTFVISAAIDTVRLAIDAKAIQLNVVLDPDIGQVLGDAARLQQVVWNLLSNAAKFTPAGGQISVELTQVGPNAQLQVRDTGKGIHPQFLPYVFEHFRQEDGATTRKFGGLGLGLAIARQIVEMHGGTIWADSPGENLGATFTVKLPLATIATQATQTGYTADLDIDLTGLRVLVVDDEADMRELAEFILKQHGADVSTAASAQAALLLLDRGAADVLISDIGMPEMDGYMLMRQVRRRSATNGAQIPAIALTAYAGELDQKQALSAGFQQHLSKPVEPDKLVRAVAELLRSRQELCS